MSTKIDLQPSAEGATIVVPVIVTCGQQVNSSRLTHGVDNTRIKVQSAKILAMMPHAMFIEFHIRRGYVLKGNGWDFLAGLSKPIHLGLFQLFRQRPSATAKKVDLCRSSVIYKNIQQIIDRGYTVG
jgi:hypothetical protein